MDTLRFGVIGCGNIGQLRAAALAKCRYELAAVTDLDAERARSLAARYGAEAVGDWRSLLERTDVDAAIVCTPPSQHVEMCVAALEAGKHVLCEKPLALDASECRKILAAAERGGRVLATGFNYRFYPSFQKARELLDSGIIGELDHIRSYSGYSATDHGQEWVHDVRAVGGGALRDNGIHLIDLTRWFLGEVSDAGGYASNSVWRYEGCEDNGFLLLRNPAGKVATLHASWSEWHGYTFRVEIYGTRGCIRASCFPMMVRLIHAKETGARPRRKTHYFPLSLLGEHIFSYRWIVTRSFVEELRDFSRAVRGEATRLATGTDGLRAIEIAQAAMWNP